MKLRQRWLVFVELMRGRRMPLRDARDRLALIPCELPHRKARLIYWGLIGGVSAGAAAIFLKDGWIIAAIYAGFFAIIYGSSVKEAMSGLGDARIKLRIRRGYCPWCNGELTSALENDRRRCLSCKSEWWDVAGLEPGMAPHTQKEHVIAIGIGLGLIGLFMGALGSGPIPSDSWMTVLTWVGVALGVWFFICMAAGHSHAPWWTALSSAFPGAVYGFVLLSGNGHTVRAEALLVSAALFGTVGSLGARVGRRRIRRDIREHEGRICASCGYDMRGAEAGDPCPECQSPWRVR